MLGFGCLRDVERGSRLLEYRGVAGFQISHGLVHRQQAVGELGDVGINGAGGRESRNKLLAHSFTVALGWSGGLASTAYENVPAKIANGPLV